jgi:ubiquitin-activating enzyme E1
LSGGAIAGIVIGVIAGIILLLFICLICCLGATIDTILAFFGLRNRRRRGRRVVEEEVIERRRRSGRADSRRWYGTEYEARPPRTGTTVTRIEERRRRTDGLGGLARVGAGLGGLALALGIKRRVDQRRRRREDKSDTESSYYDSSYYYSGSGKLNP